MQGYHGKFAASNFDEKDPGETSKYEKTPKAEDETSKVDTKRALKGYGKKTKGSIGDLSLELAKLHVSSCMLELAIFITYS